MAITNFAELKTAIADWMARSDVSGSAADFIALAESRLNRELNPVETDTTLTGTLNSRRIDISSLSLVAPIALFLVDGDEMELTQRSDGTFPYDDTSGEPSLWALDGTNIDFDRPLDEAYSFRFRYWGRFALSDSATTNWLLTNHPDIYLAASIVWGGAYIEDMTKIAFYKGILDEAIPSVRSVIARKKRGVLTVDPALRAVRPYYTNADIE